MNAKYYVSWEEVFERLEKIDRPEYTVYGIPKGGMILTAFLKKAKIVHKPENANFILDDVISTGCTLGTYVEKYGDDITYHALFETQFYSNKWLVMPWETACPGGEDNIQDNITRILQYIGEDVTREGLRDTPKRVIKSYGEMFAGCHQDPKDIFTCFEDDTTDQMVLLKNIEMYSTCEHHMISFFGKAHIAYIPDKKIVGISKLARLLDIYAKRLQIQERIGKQVTDALMQYLQPKGAACIIEAKHLCMCQRGVSKQNSVMTTSSLTGVFLNEADTRNELIQLIKL
jgi:GTP cyclohydrolase I